MKYFTLILLFAVVLCGCSPNNVTTDDSLEKFFRDNRVKGTFGLYDNGKGNFIIYNLGRFKDSAYLPASTFKIVNSLVGLETGVIENEKMIIRWDGVVRTFSGGDTAKAWNEDLTMEQAFKMSAVPYYQEVARRIGKDTMQRWLDTLGYASKHAKARINRIDSFWLDNSIRITADEQLGLVKKLYFDQLPFQKRSMRIVREVMIQERNSNYTLAYKTGWGFTPGGTGLGWVVGWIIENKHPHFFVLNVEGAHDLDFVPVRLNITKGILRKLGYLEGKM